MSKAYNSIDQDRLKKIVMKKVHDEETASLINRIIESYNTRITETYVKCKRGVPQGSVLSP